MIYVHDLWKSYNSLQVLKGLSLDVPSNKTMIILGRSGVGKSVLLRQIIGIEKPDKGFIKIGEMTVTSLPQQEMYRHMSNFGMLFQSSALFDSMTVGDNVAFYLKQHGDPKSNKKLNINELYDRVEDSLTKVGLSGYQNKMPSELSGGQKRRAALARLIIYKPKILLFDEPTTGLDPITSQQINELIAQTQEELKATTIVVTHDINSALRVGHYFALHHEGKIALVDTKDNFIKNDTPLIRDFFENAIIPEKYTSLMKVKVN